jgi:DHA2 family multidrug resistance protein
VLFTVIAWALLKRYEDPLVKNPIDAVGFLLLVIWVGSLQIMLDEGKDLDWFSSQKIVVLCVVAVIGFFAFLIWELTEAHPIVDLRVFRHRGFSASMFVLTLAFGSFFALNVLTPLWLQYNLGYTTTWAGIVVAWGGLLAVVFSPIAANLSNRFDPRWLVFIGCAWLGGDTLWRAVATTDMDYWTIVLPLFFMGVGMPMYYVPITGLAMGSVQENEMASAAGLMNFVRTIAGAFATSLVTTFWQDGRYIAHDQLSGIVDPTSELAAQIAGPPALAGQAARELFDHMVTGQSMQLATNGLMLTIAVIFFISAFAIALAPKPSRAVDAASIGH